MKARVYVTLKNGVLDPQGKAIHHALEGLGFDRRQRRARRQADRARPRRRRRRRSRVEAMCRKLLANTVIENFRIERGAAREERRHRLPGSNCDRDLAVALEQVTGRSRHGLAPRDRAAGRPRPHRGARRLLLRRLSALRRDGGALAGHARGEGRGGARRGGARRLQRLPDPDRGGAAARRADAQRRHPLRLPRRAAQGREQPVRLHQPLRCGRGDRHPGRPP
jgi:phosphoribosylformylglycinamidine synthase PurS subunit